MLHLKHLQNVYQAGLYVYHKLKRNYKLDAPKGVNGRNSDNTLIQKLLGWEPSTRLYDGLEKTYAWIYEQIVTKAPCPTY